MRKKTDDEFGVLITREMKSMLLDDKISYENRARILCSIIGDEKLDDPMMSAFADSLKTGFQSTNNKRKAEILSRRKRQAGYQRALRGDKTSTVDERASTVDERLKKSMSVDARASLNKAKQSKVDNIPLNPPSGVEGSLPSQITPEDLTSPQPTESVKAAALELAGAIEQTEAFARMRVNRGKLMKCICSVLKKNAAAEGEGSVGERILAALAAWTVAWKADDWRFVPGRITDWLYDGKWLEAPRKRADEVSVGSGCGECGVMIG